MLRLKVANASMEPHHSWDPLTIRTSCFNPSPRNEHEQGMKDTPKVTLRTIEHF
jgi:hypothetical protein